MAQQHTGKDHIEISSNRCYVVICIQERRTITMVEYGDPNGLSAMARAVGIPAGVAAKLILEGDHINATIRLTL